MMFQKYQILNRFTHQFLKTLALSSGIICIIFQFPMTTSANVVGVDTQNFNVITNGLDFVTVHSSETLEPGIFNLGLFLNYATNSLPNLERTSTQSLTDVKDTVTSMDFHLGVGLTRDWDVGIAFPRVIRQSIEDSASAREVYAQTGQTEIRLNTKYRFIGDTTRGIAAILSMNIPQIENNPFTGINPGPTINMELAADTTVDKIAIGGNVGYRVRNPGEALPNSGVQPFTNQWIASAAASYLLTQYDTKLIVELFGSVPAEKTEFVSDRDLSSLELLTGLKWDATTQLAAHAGTGFGLMHGAASPDFRVYTGLNYTFGPLWGTPSDQDVREAIARRPVVSDEEPMPAEPNYFVIDNNADVFDRDPTAPIETFVAREILFAFDSSEIREEFYPILAKLANYLQRGGGFTKLIIGGHTDSVGSDAYNQSLSKRRAESVRQLLLRVTKTEPSKVQSIGYGEKVPIADNGNYQGRQLNRRVEFKIYRDL